MGIIDIELLAEDRPWGLFTEEKQPRIILPMWLVKRGQTFSCQEEDLSLTQLQIVENSYRLGIIRVTGASFLEEKVEEVFVQEETESLIEEKETPFQKLMREKRERLELSRRGPEKPDPTLNEEEVSSFLKRRQDKIIVDIKKGQKSLSFFKACKKQELERSRKRKKIIEVLDEVIELKIAAVERDHGGMQNPDKSNPESLLGGSSYLENQYSQLLTEEELTEPEEEKALSKEEIEELIRKLEQE